MRFSIITCTYNSEKYIQDNIDSVKNQSFEDFEHIFIDGFSTDGTVEMIKKYQQEFPDKVKFFQFEAKGIANAMNNGIVKATGEYIMHLHSDDSLYNNQVLSCVDKFLKEKKNPDLVYGKAKFIYENNSFKVIPHRKVYHKLRYWLLLLTNYIPHQATFIRTNVFEKHGLFDETYKNSMDYEMWVRLSKNNINALFFNLIICNFSIRSDAQSVTGAKNCVAENRSIQQKYVRSKILQIILAIILKINSQRSFK